MRAPLVIAVLIAPLAAPQVLRAQYQIPLQPSSAPEIAASGVAEIRLAPDRAAISISVETRDKSASAAMAANTRIVNEVSAALRRAKIVPPALSTTDVSVDQYYPPRYDPREPPAADGFVVRTGIRAETENIASVSQIIDSALAAGATRIGVQYSSSKMSDARRSALGAALNAARADAEAVAAASGGRLGRLLSAMPSGASPVLVRGGVAAGTASGTLFSLAPPPPPPSITTNVVVTARWEFISTPKE